MLINESVTIPSALFLLNDTQLTSARSTCLRRQRCNQDRICAQEAAEEENGGGGGAEQSLVIVSQRAQCNPRPTQKLLIHTPDGFTI